MHDAPPADSAATPHPPRSLATIALLFLPIVGWVGFNIVPGLLNQLARMSEMAEEDAPKAKAGGKKRR